MAYSFTDFFELMMHNEVAAWIKSHFGNRKNWNRWVGFVERNQFQFYLNMACMPRI